MAWLVPWRSIRRVSVESAPGFVDHTQYLFGIQVRPPIQSGRSGLPVLARSWGTVDPVPFSSRPYRRELFYLDLRTRVDLNVLTLYAGRRLL
jgi:hypothetical protein